jgi:catecholate siderophore receptor
MRPFLLAVALILTATTPLAAGERSITGHVVDGSGSPIAGAAILLRTASSPDVSTLTDAQGRFALSSVPAGASITASFDGFSPATVALDDAAAHIRLQLEPTSLAEQITVVGARPVPTRSSTATKTDTPLRDVPQSVTVISREAIRQQTMNGIADVVRYVPGVGIAQGEGNRDTPVLRGNSSTSDFFVDGIRDDVQYFRDLYNVERVEALKGPNAMIFGRGGVGGVLNRVTRQAGWAPVREVTLRGGSWNDGRVEGDFGEVFSGALAARVTGVYENSGSYRHDVHLERRGINPTLAFALSPRTMVRAGYEYFYDERTADRGISSFAGRPVTTPASTFFGNADLSRSRATVNSIFTSVDHQVADGVTIRSRIVYAHYDKFYQNVFPGSVDASGTRVSISAYNNATRRRNLFNQTDLVLSRRLGRVGHTLLAGLELGRQVTDNFRRTGFFTSLGENITSVMAPLDRPTTSLPIVFRQSATDADNHGVAEVAAIYLQDQIALSPRWQVVAGLRYDDFQVDLRNNRTAADFTSSDGLLSPRLGVIYKPVEPVSIYASYSLSYLPRAGEQLSSLNGNNQSLDPEEFRNYEIGAKWDVAGSMEFAAALYRLDRANVAVADPVNPAVTLLVSGQRTRGLELSLGGRVTEAWSMIGAYARQDGEITRSLSSSARAGARLAQLPAHSFSLWNQYDLTPAWGVGAGVIHRGEIFTSTDNSVALPGFTRVDAGVFYTINEQMQAQMNVENLLDTDYFAFAHNNTNITPGSPRAIRLSWTTRF